MYFRNSKCLSGWTCGGSFGGGLCVEEVNVHGVRTRMMEPGQDVLSWH